MNAGDSQRRNLNATPASARECVGCDLIFTPRAPLRKVLTHHDILTLVEPNCILTCVLSLAEFKVPQSDGRRRRSRRASTFGQRSAAGRQHAKDRDTWPTRQSLGTPHIYKHMVKMYSAGVDGHQMSGIVLSHTAASSEGIQHNCRPHLSRGGVGDHVIAPYEGAGESVHAQYSCNALVAASWRLYW